MLKEGSVEGRAATEVSAVEFAEVLIVNRRRLNEQCPVTESNATGRQTSGVHQPQFRLYKRRHAGVLAIIALNIVAGMSLTWFGPIANKTSDTFGISLDEVNWLGNIVACTYIVVAPLVPIFCTRFGIRICYMIGSVFMILAAWVRYAGTTHSLNSRGEYALLIFGQFLGAIPQVVFQVLAPKFSETWFDLKGRTTATMLMSVSNPVGTALGQLISPMIGDVRVSILILGIISTAITPITLLIGARPPTPPSYSGSQPSHHFLTTFRAIFGALRLQPSQASNYPENTSAPVSASPVNDAQLDSTISNVSKDGLTADDRMIGPGISLISPIEASARTTDFEKGRSASETASVEEDAYMTLRERFDFVILTVAFSVLVSGVNTFSILSNEILEPYGYSEDTAGLMGAALLLSGLAAAFATSPLFDRVLTHHLGLSVRIAVPIIAVAWLSLIWAVRPNNTGALYAIFVVIGVCSLSMLPVALELGCELTRNSDASSAILWCSANIASIVFTLVMSALRAPSDGSPPFNMHRSLIYSGTSICCGAVFILMFRGEQKRRQRDARVAAEAKAEAEAEAAAAVATSAGSALASTGDGQAQTNNTETSRNDTNAPVDDASKSRRLIPFGFISIGRRRQGKNRDEDEDKGNLSPRHGRVR